MQDVFENSMPKGNWDWCKDTDKDRTYLNLWSTNNTTDGFIDGNVVKTVYDPCPAGFHMPKAQEFTKVNAGNNHKKGVCSKPTSATSRPSKVAR